MLVLRFSTLCFCWQMTCFFFILVYFVLVQDESMIRTFSGGPTGISFFQPKFRLLPESVIVGQSDICPGFKFPRMANIVMPRSDTSTSTVLGSLVIV